MNLFNSSKTDNQDQWMSISDMMSVMMFIFMIIAIIYARSFVAEPTEKCDTLFKEIKNEFSEDFKEWKVDFKDDMTIRFDSPKVQFESQSYEIRKRFKIILDDFWPRYIKLLEKNDDIKEIRVEGHTSKKWGDWSAEQAYFKNMELSQARTRSILEYVFALEKQTSKKEWMRKYITANGLSSSHPEILNGVYSDKKSRRIEFRSISKACLKAGKQQ